MPTGEEFDLSSPIVSCASSFDGDRFVHLKPSTARTHTLQGVQVQTQMQEQDMVPPQIMDPLTFGADRKRKADVLMVEVPDDAMFLQQRVPDHTMPPKSITKHETVEQIWTTTSQVTSAALRGHMSPFDQSDDSLAIAKRKQDHNCHTRRSREKLNDKFERLVNILPKTSSDVELKLKHKAQVLDHTVVVLDSLLNDVRLLEMELALMSRENTIQWIEKIVRDAKTSVEAFRPFLEILCLRNEDVVAELWSVDSPEGGRCSLIRSAVSPRLGSISDHAAPHTGTAALGELPTVRQCVRSMRSLRADTNAVRSAQARWGRKLSDGIAVPIIFCGRVKLVGVFYHDGARLGPSFLETAELVATCMGNTYSSKLAHAGKLSST
eukprot:CAMPEP_0198731526 /NCGR_PEP_ID=MMETSP1475-20131203/30480_1 /TAXON_ID= ORGANISM="Unidentified sp., Strain CCMP1999" /NCGR_SAMPLE_ID=MMETSP1475 /ASSEMBLY_ACC=CAM_ASM_001111 /LENGTH=379 /DNA_ID=CAMNT_0044494501 /DNA_START=21 /DNA_END=1160 /DNA_ORIENTATION=+